MTAAEIKTAVSRVLGISPESVLVGRTTTSVMCSISVNYDQLLELSRALQTTKIDFDYTQGTPGYSSRTPGCDASFSFTIGIGAQP